MTQVAERVGTAADVARGYARDVVAGRVVAGRLVRLACEKHLRWLETGNGQGYWFDGDAAQKVVDFFGFLKHRKGAQFAGQAIVLEPWQVFCTASMFGWKRPDGLRVFKYAWIEVARKNGKSTWAAGLVNFLAFFDGEPGAEVYCTAVKRDQAKIVWTEAQWQLENSPPSMKKRFDIRVGNLNMPSTASKLEPLGSDRDSTDGLNPHALARDELHAWKDREFLDKLDGAMGARLQPLVIDITTAGSQGSTLYMEEHDYARQVVEGLVPDDTRFVYIAALDEGDHPFDESVWPKANPNLGVSKSLEYMRERAVKAKAMPSELNAFMRYQLNVITNQVDAYLSMEIWDGQEKQRQVAQLLGRRCYLSIDLSERHDLTAMELWFPDEDMNGGDLLSWFWMPEDAVERRTREDGVPYDAWVREGFLDTTPGEVVDYGFLLRKCLEIREQFDVKQVLMDPNKGRQLGVQLEGENFTVKTVQQGFAGMGPCIAEMTRLLELKGVRHGGHALLRWMAGNVAAKISPDNLVRFDKSDVKRRIDGMVAAAMAIGGAAEAAEEDPGVVAWFPSKKDDAEK